MTKGKPKALFTPSYIRLIKLARELNEKTKIYEDLYFHPTEKRIKVKTIDLGLPNPLCEVNSRPSGKQDWEERWVEAYLISKAKKNNWKLGLAGKECIFLSSQLTFRASPSLEIKGRQHRHVDLLLYDEEQGCLVILELKKEADKSSLDDAKNELRIYVNEVNRLIENEKTAVLKAFNLKVVKGVIGYIVCPKDDVDIQKLDFGEFRLIQYTKPWRDFKEVEETGRSMKIDFTCHTPA